MEFDTRELEEKIEKEFDKMTSWWDRNYDRDHDHHVIDLNEEREE